MMKLKQLLTLVIPTLLFSQYASSHPTSNQVEKCPNIKSIQAAGLSSVEKVTLENGTDSWLVKQRSDYDTRQEWLFLITGPFQATTSSEAMQEALLALPRLHKILGPYDTDEVYTCTYSDMTENGFGGIAITPPSDPRTW